MLKFAGPLESRKEVADEFSGLLLHEEAACACE